MRLKIFFIISLLIILTFLSSCDHEKQIDLNKRIVGIWSLEEVDSCRQYVVPDASIYRTKIIENQGTIEFKENGTGALSTGVNILCSEHEFLWHFDSDLLIINIKKWSYSTFLDSLDLDEFHFKLETCLPKDGLNVWYDITMIKIYN